MTSEPLADRAIPDQLADRLCYRRETEISGWVTPRLSNLLSRPLVSKSTGPATTTEDEARAHVFAVRQTKPMLYWPDTSRPQVRRTCRSRRASAGRPAAGRHRCSSHRRLACTPAGSPWQRGPYPKKVRSITKCPPAANPPVDTDPPMLTRPGRPRWLIRARTPAARRKSRSRGRARAAAQR